MESPLDPLAGEVRLTPRYRVVGQGGAPAPLGHLVGWFLGLVGCGAILTDRFLQRFFGTDPDRFLAVLKRMKLERVPYASLWRGPHPQLALPLG